MANKPMLPEAVKYIAVHCSATKPDHEVTAEEIARWHRKRGFLKIGYHYVIRRDGTLETGRELTEPGAHVQGYNSQSVGVCLAGGLNEAGDPTDNYTDEQWETLTALIKILVIKFPKATVQGHRDFPNVHKDCPCFDVKTWWASVDK
jgi:N-acetylmuramoyl-L-alanine amidase